MCATETGLTCVQFPHHLNCRGPRVAKCPECSAGEPRPVINSHDLGAAPKRCSPIQQTGDVMPVNAKVSCDVHAFVREVVCHRQAFDTPGDGARPINSITDEIHAPGLVDPPSGHQRYTHADALGLLAFPDGKTLGSVAAVHAFVIDTRMPGGLARRGSCGSPSA